jgi:hypothetical protein
MLKLYLRSRSYGLQARIHHGAANHIAKRCKLCTLGAEENERNIRTAPNNELIAYLLGGSELNWNNGAIALIDELMRPYLLKLASKRKHLMATLNNNGGTPHSTP